MSISDRTDFRPKQSIRDKEGHYLMVKRSLLRGDITIPNVYGPNTEQETTEAKSDGAARTEKSILLAGGFNTPLRNRSSRQKIRKDTDEPNTTVNQLDITDIYRQRVQ